MKALYNFFLCKDNSLNHNQSLSILIYRIFAVLLIIPFGWGKLQDYDNLSHDFFGNVIGIGDEISLVLALIVQLGCPIFLILGFQSRLISTILALHMVVATKFHFYDPYGKFCYPLAFLGMYCILVAMGPGRYSLDYILYSNNRSAYSRYETIAVIIVALSMILGWVLFYYQFNALVSVILSLLILSLLGYSFHLINRK